MRLSEGLTIVDSSSPTLFVNRDALVLDLDMNKLPITLTMSRTLFPSGQTTQEYSATLLFVAGHFTSNELYCTNLVFSDIPESPGLVSASCTPEYPSSTFLPTSSSMYDLTALLRVGVSPVFIAENVCVLIRPAAVERVDPAPTLLATSPEPRTLTLVMRTNSYKGTVPLCVRVGDGDGVVVDDAATVFAPDYVSFRYTSSDAALGAAVLRLGVFDRAGACVLVSEHPGLLTVVPATPPLQLVRGVFPRELAQQAASEGALLSLHVEGGIPASVRVSVGTFAADIVEVGPRGAIVRLQRSPGETLADVVVVDSATGTVLAHAPAAVQLQMPRNVAIVDAQPFALAAQAVTPTAPPDAFKHQVIFRGVNVDQVGSVFVRHVLVYSCDVHLHFDAFGEKALAVSFEAPLFADRPMWFYFEILSSASAASSARLFARESAGRLSSFGARRSYGTGLGDGLGDGLPTVRFEMPVVDPRVVTVTPAMTLCSSPVCETEFTATFAAPLPPYPFCLSFSWHEGGPATGSCSVLADGSLSAKNVPLAFLQNSALRLALTTRDLFRGEPRRTRVAPIAALDLDIIALAEAPRVTHVVPSAISAARAARNVVIYTHGLFGSDASAYTVDLGTLRATIKERGPFYLMLDVDPGEAAIAPRAYDVAIHYRGQHVVTEPLAIEFVDTADMPTAESLSPMWVHASGTAEQFTIRGSALNAITGVTIAADGLPPIVTSQVIPSEHGTMVSFVVAVPSPGIYSVAVTPFNQATFAVGAFVAVDTPILASITPNGTIALGPMPLATVAAVPAVGSGRALAVLEVQFALDTALFNLPVEFFAINDADGFEEPALVMRHTPLSARIFSVAIHTADDSATLVPGAYRLCYRSLIATDVSITRRELTGDNAVLLLDYDEFVPRVVRMSPVEIPIAVTLSAPNHASRTIILSLNSASGTLPSPTQLRAFVGELAAPVLFVGSRYIVLRLPAVTASEDEPRDIVLLNTLTGRSISADGLSVQVSASDSALVLPYGLRKPRLYDSGTGIQIIIDGLQRLDLIARVYLDFEACGNVVATPTLITCSVDADWVMNRIYTTFVATLYIGDSASDTAALWGEIIPPITVNSTSLENVGVGTVRVLIVYECAVDLAQFPLAVRLAGANAEITDLLTTEKVIEFTALYVTGARTATVELYDIAVEADPVKAETLVKLDASVVTFHFESKWADWEYALVVIVLLMLLILCFVLLWKYVCRSDESDDDDDDDDGEDDEEGGAPATLPRASDYHALN